MFFRDYYFSSGNSRVNRSIIQMYRRFNETNKTLQQKNIGIINFCIGISPQKHGYSLEAPC